MIYFYTSHCPSCNVLKQLMDNKNIEYTEIDDKEVYYALALQNNISSMPFAKINDKYYNTKELRNYILKGE